MNTLKTDDRGRLMLPGYKGGKVFEVEDDGQGRLVLTLVKPISPKPSNVRLEKRGKYTVMVTGRTINPEEILKEIREMS